MLRPGGRLVLACHGADHLWTTWQALGRPTDDSGPEQNLRAARPVTVTAADAWELVESYGLRINVNGSWFPIQDTAHLAAYMAFKTG